MNNAKKMLVTVLASLAVGAVVGMLYAPDKGAETRMRISRFKRKFSCCERDEIEDSDRETLEELSLALKEQLAKINERLEKDAG